MKVLLIVPTHHYNHEYPAFLSLSDFPTGFAYLASALKQAGHEVVGLNPNNIVGYPSAKIMLQDVLSKKLGEKFDLIGLGGLCTDYAFLRDAISIIRSTTNTPIALGGQIVTNDAKFIMSDLRPDYAVVGEADHAIVDMATALPPAPSIIRAEYPKNLDEMPFPDYEPFGVQEMLDKYSMATRLLYRYTRPYPRPFVLVASRSCPFACTFCVHGHRAIPYRARSIENIMAEIKTMYDRYKFNILIILDELFAVSAGRLKNFCESVIFGRNKYGWDFDWMFQTHASAHLDLETLKLAKQAGCFFFSYGLESASPTVLKSMRKKIEVKQVIEAMELAKQAKVGFGANLIFGDPAETAETWAESLAFWLRYGQTNETFLSFLSPYPGSKIFEDAHVPDKHKYYEQIDEAPINVTRIPDKTFYDLHTLCVYLEKAWLFVKRATNVKVEPDGMLSKIWATCPHCGEESLYRERIGARPFFMGTGCIKCNQRMRIDVG